ncbi:ATP-grasp domain-containing protein [Halorubrum ruber]|uniref:RimK family alpha-L-glutamate ligase n=1 Tax=Halorubrum ruber TaxID=2982524 RepID=A0A8T8LMH4_9EURY|nr:RimK family alpha-L-glutamate ligase [Halorubrum ruber]QUO48359.1 RimK family alpha-L-glutamate ligase [Halorubrum ruber]
MLRLAMTTDAETFERVREPLADRDIEVGHVRAKERSLRVSGGESSAGDTGDVAAGPEEFAGFDVGLVYPTRLMEGAVVDERLGVPWVNGRDAVVASRNKAGVLARLSAAGLPTPKTTLVSNPVDESVVVDAAEEFSYPVVVKPNSATRGVGVATATDLDSLLGVVDYLNLIHDYRATGDKSFLIQEYLPDARDYRAMVVDGASAGAVERVLDDDALAAGRWKHNVHRGATAEGIALDPEARDLAERAAETLGIDYLGVDLLATDDRLVVNETNARPTVDAATKYADDFYDRFAALIRRTAETA